jgi:hypothetical protein
MSRRRPEPQRADKRSLNRKLKQLKDEPAKLIEFLINFSRQSGYEPQLSGQWTVLWPAGRNQSKQLLWFGVCQCGRTRTTTITTFRQGQPKRCGHFRPQPEPILPLEPEEHQAVVLTWGWKATRARMMPPSQVVMVVEFQKSERGPEDQIPTMYARYNLAQARWLDTIPTKITEDQLREICQGLLDDSEGAETLPFGSEQGDWLYTVRGKTRSLREWARRARKDLDEMLERLGTMPVAEALVISRQHPEDKVRIGNQEMTTTEWLKKAGISRSIYGRRLREGWDRSYALATPKGTFPLKMPIKVGSETHTLEEWARIYRETPKEILRRMPRGIQLWARPVRRSVPVEPAKIRFLSRRPAVTPTEVVPQPTRPLSAPIARVKHLKRRS